ncbi:hypothetical protein ACFIJ5_16925 [Haloimpatiens sp. FM7330]|uniref:hypothetical protein n=1 Tax=Haloimpatiens sp. FM7330 TaxID=3298610 RepID=UPI00363A3A04
MQEKFDYLDKIIKDSFEDIETDKGYDIRLMNKINNLPQKNSNRERYRIAALSLMLSGFLMLIIYTSSLQYNIINAKMKIKTSISMIEQNHNDTFNFFKFFLGE